MIPKNLTLFTVKILQQDRLVVVAEVRPGVADVGDPQHWLADIVEKLAATNQVFDKT